MKEVRKFAGLIVQNFSYVKITKSHFVNNTVEHGVLNVLSSSTLVMSDCTMSVNDPKELARAIFADSSVVYITNSNFTNNSNTAVVLKNRTKVSILNCTFEGNSSPYISGAIYSIELNILNVSNTKFLKNVAAFGGAVTAYGHSKLMIRNCLFSDNAAKSQMRVDQIKTASGGAIDIAQSVLNLSQSKFKNNSADFIGGAIISAESSLLICDSMFENNIAGSSGGALVIYDQSFATIKDSLLTNNSVKNQATGVGGGLILDIYCTLNMSNVNFTENKAQNGGAIHASYFSKITIFNSSFGYNTGSAISVQDDVSMKIMDCLFLKNLAFNKGGAISSGLNCVVNVTDTVFSENKATASGGAMHSASSIGVSLNNCLFTDNLAFIGGALAEHNSDTKLFFL